MKWNFLGEGAADLCAGEFLVPLASGRLLPPAKICQGEEYYDALKKSLNQMEELCETKEKAYELGSKGSGTSDDFYFDKKEPIYQRSILPGQRTAERSTPGDQYQDQ